MDDRSTSEVVDTVERGAVSPVGLVDAALERVEHLPCATMPYPAPMAATRTVRIGRGILDVHGGAPIAPHPAREPGRASGPGLTAVDGLAIGAQSIGPRWSDVACSPWGGVPGGVASVRLRREARGQVPPAAAPGARIGGR